MSVRKLVVCVAATTLSLLFMVVGSANASTNIARVSATPPPSGCPSEKLCFVVGVTANPGITVTRNPADTCARVDFATISQLYAIRYIYNNSNSDQYLYNQRDCQGSAVYLLLPHFGFTPGSAGTDSLVYSYSPVNSEYPGHS